MIKKKSIERKYEQAERIARVIIGDFMERRIAKIQKELAFDELLIISEDINRFYFTGFRSSAGMLLITASDVSFYIDFRYFEKAQREIKHCSVFLLTNTEKTLKEYIQKHNIKTVFLETSYAPIGMISSYRKMIPENCEISLDSRINDKILEIRSIKSAEEIMNIKEAQRLTDETFSYILDRIQKGRTELEIMLDMEFYMRKQGSEGVSFDFVVVSGKNSSLPHGVPTNKSIEDGDFITMDFGAVINGYRSDMTRTVAIGGVSDLQSKVYDAVLSAQNLALEQIKPGAVCKEIDEIARNYIYHSGYEGCFGHGLGHSVGLEIHEAPSFNTTDSAILRSGMVLTVEPGIYLESQFGVRIEDMVVINEDGYENITKSPKELIIL